MKEASGELNMTVVTIIAVGAIIGFFWLMWPTIKNTISDTWRTGTNGGGHGCQQNQSWDSTLGQCVND